MRLEFLKVIVAVILNGMSNKIMKLGLLNFWVSGLNYIWSNNGVILIGGGGGLFYVPISPEGSGTSTTRPDWFPGLGYRAGCCD